MEDSNCAKDNDGRCRLPEECLPLQEASFRAESSGVTTVTAANTAVLEMKGSTERRGPGISQHLAERYHWKTIGHKAPCITPFVFFVFLDGLHDTMLLQIAEYHKVSYMSVSEHDASYPRERRSSSRRFFACETVGVAPPSQTRVCDGNKNTHIKGKLSTCSAHSAARLSRELFFSFLCFVF